MFVILFVCSDDRLVTDGLDMRVIVLEPCVVVTVMLVHVQKVVARLCLTGVHKQGVQGVRIVVSTGRHHIRSQTNFIINCDMLIVFDLLLAFLVKQYTP